MKLRESIGALLANIKLTGVISPILILHPKSNSYLVILHSGKIGAFDERISTQDCELACVGRYFLYFDIWHRDIRTKSS